MKYYKLRKNLPTFKAGELFYADADGSLRRVEDDTMAYYHTTIKKFPEIISGDWFYEVPGPERDAKTKHAFLEYLNGHKDERFFQAVRNFTMEFLDSKANFVLVGSDPESPELLDTFYWECDMMLKEEE